uniref:Uncharacterized protein n=1 Tax=Periophthalmus magnuspinnatus TaxID=409849 RepID=A0A3B4ACQ7_9GOBI
VCPDPKDSNPTKDPKLPSLDKPCVMLWWETFSFSSCDLRQLSVHRSTADDTSVVPQGRATSAQHKRHRREIWSCSNSKPFFRYFIENITWPHRTCLNTQTLHN